MRTSKEVNNNTFIPHIELVDLPFNNNSSTYLELPLRRCMYQLLWLFEGSTTINIDFKPYTLHTGEIAVIIPGQMFAFESKKGFSGKMILFPESFFYDNEFDIHFVNTSELLSPFQLPSIVTLEADFILHIIGFFEKELHHIKDEYHNYIVTHYLHLLLFEMERKLLEGTIRLANSIHNSIERQFCKEVELHFKESKCVEFYLERLQVTPKILSKEVQSHLGMTPKEYINKRTLLEIKRLLAYSNIKIKEIGISLGFNEATNLNKYFKKYSGITPQKFRNNYCTI